MNLQPDLTTRIGPLSFKNPIMTASGTFGYGSEFESLFDPGILGAIVVKGLSLEPRDGNPPPRVAETPCGMLNAIGLANIGLKAFMRDKLPYLMTLDTQVIVNIYGHSIGEYRKLAEAFKGVEGVSALEVNISCPNVASGGMAFGTTPETSAKVTEEVVRNTDKPVIVKLSPNVTDISSIAKAVESAGADAISLINTLTGMAVDIPTRKPKLANISGGLSGPAIKPVALHMVYQAAKAVSIPVIGMGGVSSYEDALEFLIAGACAVQIGAANFFNPLAAPEMIDDITGFCREQKIERIADLIGSIEV